MKFVKSEEDDVELQHDLAGKLKRVQWHGHYASACFLLECMIE